MGGELPTGHRVTPEHRLLMMFLCDNVNGKEGRGVDGYVCGMRRAGPGRRTAATTKGASISWFQSRVWFGPGLHVHATQEDTFYVVDGVLTVQFGDDIVELGPGDFGTAPPGVPHSFTNADAERACRAINLMTPGIGFDRYIDQIEKVAATADHDALDRLHAQYGVTVVGPSLAERLGLS